MSKSPRRLIRAGMVVDGAGLCAAPGAILVEGDRILDAGSPQSVGAPANLGEVGEVERRPGSVLIPALVNAHTHLDLSHIGPAPPPVAGDGGFVRWVDFIRSRRAAQPDAIRAAVRLGVELSRAGGTALVGDIAGVRSLDAVETLRESGLPGVSFLEVFGQGARQDSAIDLMRSLVDACEPLVGGVQLGVQPHAPYSCGSRLYDAAADLGLPLATHLAETIEEITFVRTGEGPFADLLRRIGVWDASITGCGLHPVDALAPALERGPWIAAHLNYIEARHLELLGRLGVSAAYCPRASEYFSHPAEGEAPHRYREMLAAGVNVALGTDSIVCLDTPDRISVLDDMRLLHRRDAAGPRLLLRMATINGARALGFDPALFDFTAGPTAGVLELPFNPAGATDALAQALERTDPPRWVVGPAPPRAVAPLAAGGFRP